PPHQGEEGRKAHPVPVVRGHRRGSPARHRGPPRCVRAALPGNRPECGRTMTGARTGVTALRKTSQCAHLASHSRAREPRGRTVAISVAPTPRSAMKLQIPTLPPGFDERLRQWGDRDDDLVARVRARLAKDPSDQLVRSLFEHTTQMMELVT